VSASRDERAPVAATLTAWGLALSEEEQRLEFMLRSLTILDADGELLPGIPRDVDVLANVHQRRAIGAQLDAIEAERRLYWLARDHASLVRLGRPSLTRRP
jgi:hypothetical protein